MLTNTFIHIQGIGLKTEKRFWAAGIHGWDDFVEPYPRGLSIPRVAYIAEQLDRARQYLAGHPAYFTGILPASQHWRIFPHFRHGTAYLDIETTGLDDRANHITTIALYDGVSIFHYVYGENLDDFVQDVTRYNVLVTYNGKCFDIPFIENYFGIKIDHAHIDLRYVLHSLGYSGGLKGCERQLGLDRGELAGVDGYFAVLLWDEYCKTGDRQVLETLLAYNIEDVVNLEFLMIEAYNRRLLDTPFIQSHQLPHPSRPAAPFRADRQVIDRLLDRQPTGIV